MRLEQIIFIVITTLFIKKNPLSILLTIIALCLSLIILKVDCFLSNALIINSFFKTLI